LTSEDPLAKDVTIAEIASELSLSILDGHKGPCTLPHPTKLG